jgi:hypothetical protein
MMNVKVFISLCLLMASIVMRANDTIPQGLWDVTQITIEKNTDGNVELSVYDDVRKVKSFIPCPQIWEFRDSTTLVMRYLDNTEESGKYTLEDERFTVDLAVAMQSYQYTLSEGKLTLRITHNYVNNLPEDHTESIEEKWIIELKMQKQVEK